MALTPDIGLPRASSRPLALFVSTGRKGRQPTLVVGDYGRGRARMQVSATTVAQVRSLLTFVACAERAPQSRRDALPLATSSCHGVLKDVQLQNTHAGSR
ncbi:hypothetical protein VUR80DRAFT_7175 [Thermomyces stellatus]